MDKGRVVATPTGYGVIKITARKLVTVPRVDAPTAVQIPPHASAAMAVGRRSIRVNPAR